MAEFVRPIIEVDPPNLESKVYEYIISVFPDWTPKPGHLITVNTEAYMEQVAELMRLLSDVPEEIFMYYGQLLNLPPLAAAPASGQVEFTAVDNAGYIVPANTAMRILRGGDDYVAFATVDDLVIPTGSTTATADVLALVEGADGNDLTAKPELLDLYNYIADVNLVGTTGAGQDQEDIIDYLDRLSTRLKLMADRPILPNDFSLFARTVVGVQRALPLDLYNPDDNTWGNARYITIVPIDQAGVAVIPAVRDEAIALLQAAREVNFVVKSTTPTYTVVNVVATVRALPGVDTAALDATITATVLAYLSPGSWGIPPGNEVDQTEWDPRYDRVRYGEVWTVIDNVQGVDYVESLSLNGGALGADVVLAGVAPLPDPASTAAITVNAA